MIGNTLVKQRTANTVGYDREAKIRNLKKAIKEGYDSGICEDFDADSFLKQLKSESEEHERMDIESKF